MAKKDIINNIFKGVERAMEAFKNYRKVGSASKFIIRDTHPGIAQMRMGKKIEDKQHEALGDSIILDHYKRSSPLWKDPIKNERRKKEIKRLTEKLGGEVKAKKVKDALNRIEKAPYN